jgi:hypothetical protein
MKKSFLLGTLSGVVLAAGTYMVSINYGIAQSETGSNGGGSATYGSGSQTTTHHGIPYSTVGSPEAGNPPPTARDQTGVPTRQVAARPEPAVTTAPSTRADEFRPLFPRTTIPPNFATPPPNPFVDQPAPELFQAPPERDLTNRINNVENDAELRRQMQSVASWLQDFTVRNSRFPSFGDNTMWAEQQLSILVPMNPYDFNDAIATSANTAPPPNGRVRLSIDQSLNGNAVQQFLNDPPLTWIADPGTISAISNNLDLYIVWAAGADGRPLRDSRTGRVYIVTGRWGFPR